MKVLYIRICDNEVYSAEIMTEDTARRMGDGWIRTHDNDHPHHSFAIFRYPDQLSPIGELQPID